MSSYPQLPSAGYFQTYDYFLELGQQAFDQGNYNQALYYFERAYIILPSQDILSRINLTKRFKEGRIEDIVYSEQEVIREEVLDRFDRKSSKRKKAINKALDSFAQKPALIEKISSPKDEVIPEETKTSVRTTGEFLLTDEIWATQPDTSIEIDFNSQVNIKGRNIKRFLVVNPIFLEVERIDRDTIKVSTKKIGTTFLHLWDDRGRWTFTANITLPASVVAAMAKQEALEEVSEPFRLGYVSDWVSYSTGQSLDSVERETLRFEQEVSIEGDTPYGEFDSSVRSIKFQEDEDITGYTVGLTNGRIGNFEDFNIRGFDFYKSLSALTLTGEGLQGALLEAKAFKDNIIGYDVLWGRERLEIGYLSPGLIEQPDAYIQGAKVTLFPEKDNNYSFNFAQGYGDDRDVYLKNNVFSFQTENILGPFRLSSEIASDEENYAALAGLKFRHNDFDLNLQLRDIHEDFTTISGWPTGRGEIGGLTNVSWSTPKFLIYSNLDVYKDRYLPNPDNPDKLNLDLNSSLSWFIDNDSRLRTSLRYLNAPGIISPHRDFQMSNTYSRRFPFFSDRELSVFLGTTYQRSRYPLSPASNYDRYELFSGLRFPLIASLYYYLNYNSSWVEESFSGLEYNPSVLSTGFDYYASLTPWLSMRFNLGYRDEENTEGTQSFLAGEDSLDASLGLTFSPRDSDFEFFVDGRMRSVWAENALRDAYNETEVRWGVRSSWDLPLRWDPEATISGAVFKDTNGNNIKDPGEEGIPGAIIKIGENEVTTNENGEYYSKARAKRASVLVDISSLPEGYIFSSELSKKVDIVHGKSYLFDFAISTHSGIYGIVFWDKNGNEKADAADEFISEVKIILDDVATVFTDNDGRYFFSDVEAGSHTVKLDVNSLPLQYIPLVKVTNEIDLIEGTTYTFDIPLKVKAK